jgi:hypothetical protein
MNHSTSGDSEAITKCSLYQCPGNIHPKYSSVANMQRRREAQMCYTSLKSGYRKVFTGVGECHSTSKWGKEATAVLLNVSRHPHHPDSLLHTGSASVSLGWGLIFSHF